MRMTYVCALLNLFTCRPRVFSECVHVCVGGCTCVWVNVYIEDRPLCVSNPHWAAALICIQPQGTSAPSHWLGIRDGEEEWNGEKWGREREWETKDTDLDIKQEGEVPSYLVNTFLMHLIPFSRGSGLPPSITCTNTGFFFLSHVDTKAHSSTPRKWNWFALINI